MSNIDKKNQYKLVAGSYYKLSEKPLLSGSTIRTWIPWHLSRLKEDLSKYEIKEIPRYDGFCYIPEHINHQQVYGAYFNKYEPLTHVAQEGAIDTTMQFLSHIFGDQIELGLDYLNLLYVKPLQKLPILCLVSKERGTGKTTFLNWLKDVFQHNMTYNNNEDFRSQFNSGWVKKLIIGIDEVFFDKQEDAERLKNLATARIYKSEAKGKDRIQEEFFGKFILCSNNELNFVKIDHGEDRFWVRKVGVIKSKDNNLRVKLEAEVPHFLWFLQNRKLTYGNTSRLYFDPGLTYTKALQRVINNTTSEYEIPLIYLLNDIAESVEVDFLTYSPKDIQALARNYRLNISRKEVFKFLKTTLSLKAIPNTSTYIKFMMDRYGTVSSTNDKGRYYSIPIKLLKQLIDDFDD